MNGVEKIVHFSIGEPVTARESIFGLTACKKYMVLGYGGDCIQIKNDLDEEGWYAIEYFQEFVGLYQ